MLLCDILRTALDIILPGICPVCGKRTIDCPFPICVRCRKRLYKEEYFSIKYTEYISEIRSCFLYNGIVKDCIIEMKYKKRKNMVLVFRDAVNNVIARSCATGYPDLILPVPVHPVRLKERGFNQARLIGELVSRITGSPLCTSMLIKTKNTPSQTGQSLKKRMENLSGSFYAIPSATLHAKNILLVDDVVTTGATLETCAKELLRHGAKIVTGFTLARTL